MLETVKKAKIGTIIPVTETQEGKFDALEYFAKLSNHGSKKHSILIQQENITFGTADPALVLRGKGEEFEIQSLSETGKKLLNFVKKDFGFCDQAKFSKDTLKGKIGRPKKNTNESAKFKQKTHMDVIRTVAFKFKQQLEENSEYCGLFGMIGDDFIDSFEELTTNKTQNEDNDYLLYFIDNGFIVDSDKESTTFIANALITDSKGDKTYQECVKKLKAYEKATSKKLPKAKKSGKKSIKLEYDTSDEKFMDIIREIRKQIVNGSVIQANPSRLVTASCDVDGFAIYKKIYEKNSGYSFYIVDETTTYMGSHSCISLSVQGNQEKTVQLSSISTERPRGYVGSELDVDLDNKRAVRIWADEHELTKHLIGIDSSRNEISRISQPGTRNVDRMFAMKKRDENQYLISRVTGKLKNELDALHAVHSLQGNDAGIPKLAALKLIRELEETSRGLSNGLFVSLNPDGNMKCIKLDTIKKSKKGVSFRTGSYILHNGAYEKDLQKSSSEEQSFVQLLKESGGLK